MIDDSQLSDEDTKTRGTYRLLKVAIAGLFLVFVYVWFFIPPNDINNPVVLQRDQDGQLKPVGDHKEGARGNIALHAGGLKSSNNTSRATSSRHFSPAYFSSRSLIILNLSDHPLMNRIGKELLELFKQEKQFERLEYYPFEHLPEPGIAAPDQFLTLQLESINESGLLGRTLDAKIIVTLGNDLRTSNSHTSDHLSPPMMRFDSTINLEHHSTMNGVESSGAKYQMQGKDIAKELLKQVLSTIKDYREKFELVPQLDPGFYPAWGKSPEFQFLESNQAQLLTSVHGLMYSNKTFWQVDNIDAPEQFINEIAEELEQSGWKGRPKQVNPNPIVSLRMTKMAEVLKVFQPRSFHSDSSDQLPLPYYIRYLNRSSTKDLEEVFGKLLSQEKPDYELMLQLRRYASGQQRDQIIEHAAKDPSPTTETWIALAEYYSGKKDQEKTIDALKRLYHLTFSKPHGNNAESRIKSIAKKMNLDLKQIKTIDLKLFEELGFVRFSKGMEPLQVVLSEGGEARFLLVEKDKPWKALTIQVTPVLANQDPTNYQVVVLQTDERKMRSWTSSSGRDYKKPSYHSFQFNKSRGSISIEKLPDSTLQVTVKFDKET